MNKPCSLGPTNHLLNVKDFGAVGDGATLDHDAFNAALTRAASEGGSTVLVPPGRYLIGGTARPGDGALTAINMLSDTALYLCPGADLIQVPNNLPISAVVVFKDGVFNAHIFGEGEIIGAAPQGDQDPAGVGEHHGIVFSDCIDCTARGITTRNHFGEGVLVGTGAAFGGTGLAINSRCFEMLSYENARQGWAVVNAREGGVYDCVARDMLQVEDGGVSPGAGIDVEAPGTGLEATNFQIHGFQSFRNRIGATISTNPNASSKGVSFADIDIRDCNNGFSVGFNNDDLTVDNVNIRESEFAGATLVDAPTGKSNICFGVVSGNQRGIVTLPQSGGITARTGWRVSAKLIDQNRVQGVFNQQDDFGVSYTKFGQNGIQFPGIADIQSFGDGLDLFHNVHESQTDAYFFQSTQTNVRRYYNTLATSIVGDASVSPKFHEIINDVLVSNV